MALRRRGFVSVGAVVACCALAVACSPNQAPASTPSLTPVATTPAESQIERQMRLDYEAAEKAYRANIAEQDRLYQAGGIAKLQPLTQSDRNRRHISGLPLQSLRAFKKAGWHATGVDDDRGRRANGGWQENEVGLTSCEDSSRHAVLRPIGQGRDASRNRRLCAGISKSCNWMVDGRYRRP